MVFILYINFDETLHVHSFGTANCTAQCGNYWQNIVKLLELITRICFSHFLSQFLSKNFVEAMVSLKKLLNNWFDDFFFQWATFHFVEKREILSHWKKIRQINSLEFLNSKTIAFTKVLRKKCEREFLQFQQFHCATLRKLRKFFLALFY